jgi:hypothetical protein
MNKSLVWKPTGQGHFRCTICPTHESVEARRIAGHEEGRNHKRNLERHDTPAQQASGSTSRGESSSQFQNQPVPAARVRRPLASLLAQVAQDPDPHRRQNNYVDQDTGVVNWDSDLLNFNTHFHFWGRVSTFWNKKNAEWGPDLKSARWMQCVLFPFLWHDALTCICGSRHINKIITEERALYPNDPLPLIPLLATPTPPPVRRPTSDPLQEVTINGSVRTTTGLAALSNYRDDQRQPSGLTATGYSAHHRCTYPTSIISGRALIFFIFAASSEMYTAERTHHRSTSLPPLYHPVSSYLDTAPSDQAPGPPLRLPPSSSVSSSGGYDENSRGMHGMFQIIHHSSQYLIQYMQELPLATSMPSPPFTFLPGPARHRTGAEVFQ